MTAARDPRVGVVSFWHETNEYSARAAGLEQWQEYELLTGAAVDDAHRGTRSVVGGFLDSLESAGAIAVPVFAAGAWPSAPAPAPVFAELLERLRDALRDAVRDAGPLDGVALNLHGAMVVSGEVGVGGVGAGGVGAGGNDAEVAIVAAVRDVCGDIPIAAVLDLHGNPSVALAAAVDALVGYQTYPHVDMWECGDTAARFVLRAIGGEELGTTIAKLPFLTSPLAQGTDGPLGDVLRWAIDRAPGAGVERVSVMAGFAYQDSARVGMSVLAVAPLSRSAEAERFATEVGERLAAAHETGAFRVERPSAADAVASAIAAPGHPVVLVDIADNIGGGSAGDGTVILAELLAQGASGAVVALADAEVARAAHDAGVGAILDVAVGGKTDGLHGAPVPVTATVESLSDGRYVSRGSWATGQAFDMGLTAVLRVDGVRLVVTERATPPFHRETLTSAGVEPGEARILVAKAAVAWRAAYGEDAKTVIEVDAPGACPIDPWVLPRESEPVTVLPAVTPRNAAR